MKRNKLFQGIIFAFFVFALVLSVPLQAQEDSGDKNGNKELIKELASKIYTQPDHGLKDLQASLTASIQLGGQGTMDMSYKFYWKQPNKRKLETVADKEKGGMGGMGGAFKKAFLALSHFAVSRSVDSKDFGEGITAEKKEDGYALTVDQGTTKVTYLFNKDKAPTALKMKGKSMKSNPGKLSIKTQEIGDQYLVTEMSGNFAPKNRGSKVSTTITIDYKDVSFEEGKTVKVGNKLTMKNEPAGDGKSKGPGGMSSTMTFELTDIKANQDLPDDIFSDGSEEEEAPESGSDEEEEEKKEKEGGEESKGK